MATISEGELRKRMIFFDKAKDLTDNSTFVRAKIGAVAIYKGKVIGKGYNSFKTHPIQKKYNAYRDGFGEESETTHQNSMHAEIMCLLSIKNKEDIDWSKVQLYIYRKCIERPHGIARPCRACEEFIRELGIEHIFYTLDEDFQYESFKS